MPVSIVRELAERRRSRSLRVLVAMALVAAASASCQRPVGGRSRPATRVSDVVASPRFARAALPIDVSFLVSGDVPDVVTFEVGGQRNECGPVRGADGRFHCTHPGLDRRTVTQGTGLVIVEARSGNGPVSVATGQITIDFDCPAVLSMSITPPIAEPGDTVVVAIEVSEALEAPPVVTRLGRLWEPPAGQSTVFTVTHPVTISDPPAPADVVVRVEDRAGNTSGDCGLDARRSFAVDHNAPIPDAQRVRVRRDIAGLATTIEADEGAFSDDVGIDHVRVLDGGGLVLARIVPEADGSIRSTSLGARPDTRVYVEAEDRFGRRSAIVSVNETWRLSIGSGASPGAGIRTGVRATPAAPKAASMGDRTVELAPDVLAPDARAAVVKAQVGFRQSGALPSILTDTCCMAAGYDSVTGSIVAFGGIQRISNRDVMLDDTWIIRWEPDMGAYGYTLVRRRSDDTVPPARGLARIAFDGSGCGVMFGGDGQTQALNDVWQICHDGQRYVWSRIEPENAERNFPMIRSKAPITYDPVNRRYVVVQGQSNAGSWFALGDVLFLEPGPAWSWYVLDQLPSTFGERHGHFVFWDPRVQGIAVGLGAVFNPSANPPYYRIDELMWTYRQGQWSASSVPEGRDGEPGDISYRQSFGYDYDSARDQLVFWGGNSGNSSVPSRDVWLMTKSSTNGPDAWRRVSLLGEPLPVFGPVVAYDAARESSIAFTGTHDSRPIGPEIWEMTLQPSWPYLQAVVDLGAQRPEGIVDLFLEIWTSGLGDADGLGPAYEMASGVDAMLWDASRAAWRPMGEAVSAAQIRIHVTDRPERFLREDGTIALSLRTRFPATEAVDATLRVDAIDGALNLRYGVP